MGKHWTLEEVERLLHYTPLTAPELVKARYWIYRHRRDLGGDPRYAVLAEKLRALWPKTRIGARAVVDLAREVGVEEAEQVETQTDGWSSSTNDDGCWSDGPQTQTTQEDES